MDEDRSTVDNTPHYTLSSDLIPSTFIHSTTREAITDALIGISNSLISLTVDILEEEGYFDLLSISPHMPWHYTRLNIPPFPACDENVASLLLDYPLHIPTIPGAKDDFTF